MAKESPETQSPMYEHLLHDNVENAAMGEMALFSQNVIGNCLSI